jgi:hypothetical protein
MKNSNAIQRLWVVIPATMLLLAPTRMPYGYYQLLRMVVCLAGCIIAISNSAEKGRLTVWACIFAVIALAFNPLLPIRLERQTWAYVDWIAGAMFIAFAVSAFVVGRIAKPAPKSDETAKI